MRPVRRSAVAAAIAISFLLASARIAQAATWTVTAGTTSSGSTTYVATASGTSSAPALTYTDVTSPLSFTCTSSVLKGNLAHLGSGVTNPLATISSSTWVDCRGFLSSTYTLSQVGVMVLIATSYANGVTIGYLSNVNLAVGGTCSYSMAGALDATYSNSTKALALAPVAGSGHSVTVHTPTPGGTACFGLVHDNDTVQFKTVVPYAFTTPLGALTITSP